MPASYQLALGVFKSNLRSEPEALKARNVKAQANGLGDGAAYGLSAEGAQSQSQESTFHKKPD
jgi:hypothetical protein